MVRESCRYYWSLEEVIVVFSTDLKIMAKVSLLIFCSILRKITEHDSSFMVFFCLQSYYLFIQNWIVSFPQDIEPKSLSSVSAPLFSSLPVCPCASVCMYNCMSGCLSVTNISPNSFLVFCDFLHIIKGVIMAGKW